jgi:hypothetical protein
MTSSHCKVPRLAGRTVPAARGALIRAGCGIGKDHAPRAGEPASRPVVGAIPGAGRQCAAQRRRPDPAPVTMRSLVWVAVVGAIFGVAVGPASAHGPPPPVVLFAEAEPVDLDPVEGGVASFYVAGQPGPADGLLDAWITDAAQCGDPDARYPLVAGAAVAAGARSGAFHSVVVPRAGVWRICARVTTTAGVARDGVAFAVRSREASDPSPGTPLVRITTGLRVRPGVPARGNVFLAAGRPIGTPDLFVTRTATCDSRDGEGRVVLDSPYEATATAASNGFTLTVPTSGTWLMCARLAGDPPGVGTVALDVTPPDWRIDIAAPGAAVARRPLALRVSGMVEDSPRTEVRVQTSTGLCPDRPDEARADLLRRPQAPLRARIALDVIFVPSAPGGNRVCAWLVSAEDHSVLARAEVVVTVAAVTPRLLARAVLERRGIRSRLGVHVHVIGRRGARCPRVTILLGAGAPVRRLQTVPTTPDRCFAGRYVRVTGAARRGARVVIASPATSQLRPARVVTRVR